jgi:hypothetical protein
MKQVAWRQLCTIFKPRERGRDTCVYPRHVARSGHIDRCILLMLSMHETYLVTIPNRIVHASGKPTQSQSKSWGFLSSLDQHEMPSFVQWAALQLHALIPMPWWSSLLAMQMDSKVTARSLCLSSYPRRSHKKKMLSKTSLRLPLLQLPRFPDPLSVSVLLSRFAFLTDVRTKKPSQFGFVTHRNGTAE